MYQLSKRMGMRALLRSRTISQYRTYSVEQRLRDANELLKKIGDEKTKESEVTISYMRKIGIFSIFVVFASIGYASTFEEPTVETVEDVKDLGKDVRTFER